MRQVNAFLPKTCMQIWNKFSTPLQNPPQNWDTLTEKKIFSGIFKTSKNIFRELLFYLVQQKKIKIISLQVITSNAGCEEGTEMAVRSAESTKLEWDGSGAWTKADSKFSCAVVHLDG